jgi:predicted peptidase
MNHPKHMVSFTLIYILCLQTSQAQLSKKYDGYEEKRYESMRYGFYKPKDYDSKKSYPLIVYLHGSRDTVSRDLVYYQPSIQNKNPSFVLTPKCENPEQGWGNTWQQGHTAATAKTLKLVDSLLQKYNIDTNRLYIYGISMGAFGVFSIVTKEKGKFAAAYAICGGSDVKAASQLLETPLWIFHGDADDIVPVYLSRDLYKEIIRLGGRKVRYTEYPGIKHNSWENVSQERSLNPWLFAQKKNPSN